MEVVAQPVLRARCCVVCSTDFLPGSAASEKGSVLNAAFRRK
jgi:hypothetical protein